MLDKLSKLQLFLIIVTINMIFILVVVTNFLHENGVQVLSNVLSDPDEEKLSLESLLLDMGLGQLDSSRKYKYSSFIFIGTKWKDLSNDKVGMATFTTLDRSYWLTNMAAWRGVISVSFLTPDVDFTLAVYYVLYLRKCFTFLKEQVSFHFVFPVDKPPANMNITNEMVLNCEMDSVDVLNYLLSLRSKSFNTWFDETPYPQNLLRNVARNCLPTEYVITTDIDIIFTDRHLRLDSFLSKNEQIVCNKCAYVIPVYEVKNEVAEEPSNKLELVDLVMQNMSRPYLIKFFPKSQEQSQLKKWETLVKHPNWYVAYQANYSFWYDPIYLTKNDCPLYDERFTGYGLSRTTQVYEMFLAGWQFHLLNEAFMIHWGYIPDTTWFRKLQTDHDYVYIFPHLLRELSVRYDKDPLNLLKTYVPNVERNIRVESSNRTNANFYS